MLDNYPRLWFDKKKNLNKSITSFLVRFEQVAVGASRSKGFATYPAFITNAPVTEVSKTTNGVRVASEV